jgi:hypothetical protein
MPKPLQETIDVWNSTFDLIPWSAEVGRGLTIIDMDTIPQEDGRGWRRCDGFKGVWEGMVDQGEADTDFQDNVKRYSVLCRFSQS